MGNPLLSVLANVLTFAVPLLILFIMWRVWSSPRSDETSDPDSGAPRLCRQCGYDLRASGKRCPECGCINVDRRAYLRRLSGAWPSNPIVLRTPAPDEKLEMILSTGDAMEADLLRQQLIARGMNCILQSAAGSIDPVTIQPGQVYQHVMVFSGDIEMAQAYYRAVQGLADGDE